MANPSTLNAPSTNAAGRILVADDNPASRDALASVLSQSGFVTRTVANSTDAVALVESGEIDVVVADINMPGNERLEMARALADREEAPPVILVTGSPSIETAALAVRLRVFDYLLKPVDGTQLIALATEAVKLTHRLRSFRRHRVLFAAASAEIERCAQLARSASLSAANEALSTYFKLAVQHALATIADIGTLAEAALARDEKGTLRERLDTMHPMLLLDAIRETIRVLEGTKSSFRSRELADLRIKLERLLNRDSESTRTSR